jgi:hypothetical protein
MWNKGTLSGEKTQCHTYRKCWYLPEILSALSIMLQEWKIATAEPTTRYKNEHEISGFHGSESLHCDLLGNDIIIP